MSEQASSAPTHSHAGAAPAPEGRPAGLPPPDVNEYGGKKDGVRQSMNRRLFMQLLVFQTPSGSDGAHYEKNVLRELSLRKMQGVLYADVNDPRSFGLLTWSEDPAHFVERVRPLFQGNDILGDVRIRDDYTMIGRTYSFGYEPDLEFVLLQRSVNNVLNEELNWHVWYPLRRSGAFMQADAAEQAAMMREHAAIGMAYGQAGLGHDIRLACHGLDAKDNEFVIGLVGKELHPLSHLVQAMRKTRQTSEYIVQMGPFFVGRVVGRTHALGLSLRLRFQRSCELRHTRRTSNRGRAALVHESFDQRATTHKPLRPQAHLQ